MWSRAATILSVGLAYLLVAQMFIFHRGFDRWPRIAAGVLAVIALALSLIDGGWPFILAVSVATIAVIAAWAAASWMLRPAAGGRDALERHP